MNQEEIKTLRATLDNMNDYEKMEIGIAPIGTVNYLNKIMYGENGYQQRVSKQAETIAQQADQIKQLRIEAYFNFEQYQDNPGVLDLIPPHVSGAAAAPKEASNAVPRFEKSKLSPGRDDARAIISLLPHEYEQAVLGDGKARALFSAISAPIDFTVTFALDPLIIGGKINRSLMVAKYGFTKLGEGAISIERAFELPKVRAYWDEAGKLIDQYRNGDLVAKSAALNRLQEQKF